MSNFQIWKKDHEYANEDVFTSEYLERLKLEPELIECACGCGKLRLRFDKKGIERRFIQGHQSRGRKLSIETINKIQETKYQIRKLKLKIKKQQFRKIQRKSPSEILELIFKALPTDGTVSIRQLSKRIESSWRTTASYLDLIWRIQNGPRFIAMRAEGTRIINWRKDYGRLPDRVRN